MVERIQKDELARRLGMRMQADPETAGAWIDALVETLYESFKAGESVTHQGLREFLCSARAINLGLQIQPWSAAPCAVWLVVEL